MARSARARDTGVALLATLLQVLAPTSGGPGDEPSRTLATVGAVLALGQGAALLACRRHPGRAGAAVTGGLALQSLLVQPVPPYAALVAVWSAIRHGRGPAVRVGVPAAVAAVVLAAALRWPDDSSWVPLALAVTVGVGMAAALVEARADRAAAASERAVLEERLRIAREVHDLVGHGLTGIAVQSSTARLAVEAGDTAHALAALRAVEAGSREALAEVRQLLGLLRGGSPPGAERGLGDLTALVDAVRAAGTQVTLDVRAAGTPAPVAGIAYRVVQEALTNAQRHAAGAAVRVEVARADGRLRVRVDDDGTARQPGPSGHGLQGMDERVRGAGGELAAGPRPGGGWRVEARLPAGPA